MRMYHVGFSNRLGVSQNSIWRQNLPPTAYNCIGQARVYCSVYIRSTDLFFCRCTIVPFALVVIRLFYTPLATKSYHRNIIMTLARARFMFIPDSGCKSTRGFTRRLVRARRWFFLPLPCRHAHVVVVRFNGKTNFVYFNFYNDYRRLRRPSKNVCWFAIRKKTYCRC